MLLVRNIPINQVTPQQRTQKINFQHASRNLIPNVTKNPNKISLLSLLGGFAAGLAKLLSLKSDDYNNIKSLEVESEEKRMIGEFMSSMSEIPPEEISQTDIECFDSLQKSYKDLRF